MVAGITTWLASNCYEFGVLAINITLFFELSDHSDIRIFVIINMPSWKC